MSWTVGNGKIVFRLFKLIFFPQKLIIVGMINPESRATLLSRMCISNLAFSVKNALAKDKKLHGTKGVIIAFLMLNFSNITHGLVGLTFISFSSFYRICFFQVNAHHTQ